LNINELLNKNGIAYILECTVEGRENLSLLRTHFGLEPLPKLSFNNNFKIDELFNFCDTIFDVEIIGNSLAGYDIMSKVLYPYLLLNTGETPNFDSEYNRSICDFLDVLQVMEQKYNKTILLELKKIV